MWKEVWAAWRIKHTVERESLDGGAVLKMSTVREKMKNEEIIGFAFSRWKLTFKFW